MPVSPPLKQCFKSYVFMFETEVPLPPAVVHFSLMLTLRLLCFAFREVLGFFSREKLILCIFLSGLKPRLVWGLWTSCFAFLNLDLGFGTNFFSVLHLVSPQRGRNNNLGLRGYS